MQGKPKLIAGTALALVLALAAAPADAAGKRRSAVESQLRAMQAKIETLEARLAAQAEVQERLQAQLSEAKVQRPPAPAPVVVATQLAPPRAAAPRPAGAADNATQISGRMYFNLSRIDQTRDGASVAPSGVGFDIKRFYLGVDHRFDQTFSGNITTDVAYSRATGLTEVYVKKAYLQAKMSDALILRLGSADLPWIPFAEDAYGYRFLENTIADRTKFGTSADWGAHLLGKSGVVSYQISLVNGGGYKNPSRSASMDLEGRVSATSNGFTLGLGGYSGKLGQDVKGGPAARNTASRVDLLAAYAGSRGRIGAEYFSARNWRTVTTAASDKADGYSLFGDAKLSPAVALVGRYDHVRPSRGLNAAQADDYWNIGLNWEPAKIVDLALVYKHDKITNGELSTSNGVIGGSAPGRDGVYDEVGLFGQFRW